MNIQAIVENMALNASAPFDLDSKFAFWNAKAFGNELPSIPLRWATLKNVGGQVQRQIDKTSVASA